MVFIQHSFDLNQVNAQYHPKARCFAAGLFLLAHFLLRQYAHNIFTFLKHRS